MYTPKVGDTVYQIKGKKIKPFKVIRVWQNDFIQTDQRSTPFQNHEWGLTPTEAKFNMLDYKNRRLALLQKQIDKLAEQVHNISNIVIE